MFHHKKMKLLEEMGRCALSEHYTTHTCHSIGAGSAGSQTPLCCRDGCWGRHRRARPVDEEAALACALISLLYRVCGDLRGEEEAEQIQEPSKEQAPEASASPGARGRALYPVSRSQRSF